MENSCLSSFLPFLFLFLFALGGILLSLFTLFTFYSLNLFPNTDKKKNNEMLPKAVLQFVQVCLKVYKFNKMDGNQHFCHLCFYYSA